MNKLFCRVVKLLFVIFTGAYLSSCSQQAESVTDKVCIDDRCFHVEVAQTQQERMKGLQFREFLGDNHGMLFIFEKSDHHSFWMKNTLIALDMIWIDENKRIVSIMKDIKPCETEKCPAYTPENEAVYVLEVNGGVAGELGLMVGDQVIFK